MVMVLAKMLLVLSMLTLANCYMRFRSQFAQIITTDIRKAYKTQLHPTLAHKDTQLFDLTQF